MEDADVDVVLDKEIEELALDRPPCSILALGGSETGVEAILNDVDKTGNGYDEIVPSRLATCLIDKPLSCQDGTFDPLSSSEKNFDVENTVGDTAVSSEYTSSETLDNDIVEIHSPDLIIPDTIHVVSSSTQFCSHLQGTPDCKPLESTTSNKYPNKHNLVSCLKKEEKGTTEKNGTRYVHFSDEPGIVTEFIEPVNPWRDMRTPSKGEVISFYKNVCQKIKCKPLDKVVKQIQDLPDLSTRSGTLVLRGCRLDNRSCEALESVFKRVQFENLDLENCSLEEDGATAILEMIEFYHSTCKLNIACNPKIGLRGWQALCRMLRKTPCLTYLDARRTILTEMTMPTFGRCLKADPYLKVLHLEGVFLSGRPLLILTTALKYNRLLEELYLGDNDLTSSDGPSLGAMLTYNTTLQLLDLRNNQLKDIGLAHIGNGLSDQAEQPCGGLCSLIIWNNGLTHEGMGYLCEALVKTTTLKALNLGQNRIGDLGVQKLKPGLIKNKSLRKLGFLNTKLGSEGAVALAEVLADSWSITRIDIRENNVQTAGLMAFAMALKVNQSLLRLDLDKDIRKEPGMETVMQSVLVDIYNLCYRNKQLVKRSITPSLSASTHSISTTSISRQSSSSSEVNEPFSFDDVFHPETITQEVTPFSPVTESPIDINNAGIIFNSTNRVVDSTPSTESLGNSISPVFESSKRIRAYSDPVRKNPDPALNERPRTSRFSVTKILDSLGTHAAGVANKIAQIDNKLKKQHSKDKADIKSSELVPVLDQNQAVEVSQFKSQSEPTSEIQLPSEPTENEPQSETPIGDDSPLSQSSFEKSDENNIISSEINTVDCITPPLSDDDQKEVIITVDGDGSNSSVGDAELTTTENVDVKEINCNIEEMDVVLITETTSVLSPDNTSEIKTITEDTDFNQIDINETADSDNFVELINEVSPIDDEAVVIDDIVAFEDSNLVDVIASENDIVLADSSYDNLMGNEFNIGEISDEKSLINKPEDVSNCSVDNTKFESVDGLTSLNKIEGEMNIEVDVDDVKYTESLSEGIDNNIGHTQIENELNINQVMDDNCFVSVDNVIDTTTISNESNKHEGDDIQNSCDEIVVVNVSMDVSNDNKSVVEEQENSHADGTCSTDNVDSHSDSFAANGSISDASVIENDLNCEQSDSDKITADNNVGDNCDVKSLVDDTLIIENLTGDSSCVDVKEDVIGGDGNAIDSSLIVSELNIAKLDDSSSSDKINDVNLSFGICDNIHDQSMLEHELGIVQSENGKHFIDKTEDVGSSTAGDIHVSVESNIDQVLDEDSEKPAAITENSNVTSDQSIADNELNLEESNTNLDDEDNELNLEESNMNLDENSITSCDSINNQVTMEGELNLDSECNINSSDNSGHFDAGINDTNDMSVIDDVLDSDESKDDKILCDNLYTGDEISEKSESSFLHERLTNNEITNVNPTLEYVKITESLNEEKSIYKPYLQFVVICLQG